MILKKILFIGILMLIFSIGLGDFIISTNFQTLTLNPQQSTTISQAEILAKEPIQAQSVQGILVEGTNTYILYSPSSSIVNHENKTITLIVLHDNLLLYLDYSLILVSFSLILISVLGLLYIYITRKNLGNKNLKG